MALSDQGVLQQAEEIPKASGLTSQWMESETGRFKPSVWTGPVARDVGAAERTASGVPQGGQYGVPQGYTEQALSPGGQPGPFSLVRGAEGMRGFNRQTGELIQGPRATGFNAYEIDPVTGTMKLQDESSRGYAYDPFTGRLIPLWQGQAVQQEQPITSLAVGPLNASVQATATPLTTLLDQQGAVASGPGQPDAGLSGALPAAGPTRLTAEQSLAALQALQTALAGRASPGAPIGQEEMLNLAMQVARQQDPALAQQPVGSDIGATNSVLNSALLKAAGVPGSSPGDIWRNQAAVSPISQALYQMLGGPRTGTLDDHIAGLIRQLQRPTEGVVANDLAAQQEGAGAGAGQPAPGYSIEGAEPALPPPPTGEESGAGAGAGYTPPAGFDQYLASQPAPVYTGGSAQAPQQDPVFWAPGGGGNGNGGSVLVSYALRQPLCGYCTRDIKKIRVFWARVRTAFLSRPDGLARYRAYQATGQRLVDEIERMPVAQRARATRMIESLLLAPAAERRFRPQDLDIFQARIAQVVGHLRRATRAA